MDNKLFRDLSLMVILASETPSDPCKAWQSKTACEKTEGIDQAFLQGFYDHFLNKEASVTEVYVLGSELGKELGINMLYNMKRGV